MVEWVDSLDSSDRGRDEMMWIMKELIKLANDLDELDRRKFEPVANAQQEYDA
jgi:hypothetical protein